MPWVKRATPYLLVVILLGLGVMAIRAINDRHAVAATELAACIQRATRPDTDCSRALSRSEP
jgi:hypothetical protein